MGSSIQKLCGKVFSTHSMLLLHFSGNIVSLATVVVMTSHTLNDQLFMDIMYSKNTSDISIGNNHLQGIVDGQIDSQDKYAHMRFIH